MATNESKKRKQQKRQAVTRLVILSAILICVNMLAARFHTGLDLTKEKKFTLTAATKRVLQNMDDVAVITVYLDGKFPAGFQRLKEATREQLQSFRDFAGGNIKFQYLDPFAGKTDDEKAKTYDVLAEKGIFPVNLKVQGEEEGYSEKFIFPWALVQYKGKASEMYQSLLAEIRSGTVSRMFLQLPRMTKVTETSADGASEDSEQNDESNSARTGRKRHKRR